MLLKLVVDSAASGSSGLGGMMKRGARFIRQVLRVEKPEKVPIPEQNLVKCRQFQAAPIVPTVYDHVRRGARDILSNYLARNQMHSLAAEMRQRYAFRLMSGSTRFFSGLGNRIVTYGFVGISFGGAVHNRICSGEVADIGPQEDLIQKLFDKEHDVDDVSKIVVDEAEDRFSAVRRMSISEESDITILSDSQSDFEILEVAELLAIEELADTEDVVLCDEKAELQELIEQETQQNAELKGLLHKLCEENAILKKLLDMQANGDDMLRKELSCALQKVEEQQKELVALHNVLVRQNSVLKTLVNQPIDRAKGKKPRLRGISNAKYGGWTSQGPGTSIWSDLELQDSQQTMTEKEIIFAD